MTKAEYKSIFYRYRTQKHETDVPVNPNLPPAEQRAIREHCKRMLAQMPSISNPMLEQKRFNSIISAIDTMPDEWFAEWFTMKPGDLFWGKPGNSWGHSKDFQKLEFIRLGDWFFKGDYYQAVFKTEWMVMTFFCDFGGKVR